MGLFKNIREFFWPLLEKDTNAQSVCSNVSEIKVDSSHLQKTLEYVFDCYNSESDRRKSVEGKASLFIGTISVATSVVLGVTSILVKENEFNITFFILFLLLFILTLYMLRTIWFSIKALERKSYHTISVNDFLVNDMDDEYYRKIIATITTKITKNALTINGKVDNMTMSQEYFKRAIVVVAMYSFVTLLFYLSKSELDFLSYLMGFVDLINNIHINGWNTLVLYTLSITSIILSIISIKKRSKE